MALSEEKQALYRRLFYEETEQAEQETDKIFLETPIGLYPNYCYWGFLYLLASNQEHRRASAHKDK